MGLLPDDIPRQGALGQQGIGRDVLAANVAIGEQRDRHADLIGALGFVTPGYGQASDFF
jgi:hypothetical protein